MYVVVIPARYASTRLPGKPLLPIAGKPMLQWVYEHACAAQADEVLIATDDERIAIKARSFAAPRSTTRASLTTKSFSGSSVKRGFAATTVSTTPKPGRASNTNWLSSRAWITWTTSLLCGISSALRGRAESPSARAAALRRGVWWPTVSTLPSSIR